MKLSQLLSGVQVQEIIGAPPEALAEQEVGEVRDDSRKVQRGDLFVATLGQTVDGHRFVGEAAARGAAAAVVERIAPELSLPQLRVASTMEALGQLAANRYGRPGDGLLLVGITGTNGKSTTSFLVESLLRRAGLETGLIGTVEVRYAGRSTPAAFTTPPPLLLHQTLGDMRQAGVSAVVMEVSSHGLELGRLCGLRFRVAAFTNLTQDHLDLHGDMERYFAAKALLFQRHLLPAAAGSVAVINLDGDYGPRMAEVARAAGAHVLTVSMRGEADVTLRHAQLSLTGTIATLCTPAGEVELRSPLLGHHNLENLALGAAIGVALEIPPSLIGEGLSAVSGVPGRLERVATAGAGPLVFVDYAHTPDALARVLATLRSCPRALPTTGAPAERTGRLWVVFGCGGDRDRDKRPQMGFQAVQGADLAIVTSDNPRTENPATIVEMIVAGIAAAQPPVAPLAREELATARRGFHVQIDRRQAIYDAVLGARPEDVVLIAGKGHEDYQIIGTTKHPFDDRLVAQEALARWAGGLSGVTQEAPPSIDLPIERVLQATAGQLVRGAPRRFSRVVIDGREATPGALFVAVCGQKHDGHAFVGQAVANGASGVLVERGRGGDLPGLLPDTAVMEVGDTVVALGQIARAHRMAPEVARELQVVGITGSTGKTSCKDLLAVVLEAHAPGQVLWTEGNLNNHLGVPLTLLRLRAGLRYAVVEMGMSARGEIAYLSSLAQPDVGIITSVGPVHLASLGSVENIARAKGELFTGLDDGCVAIYPFGPGHELIQAEAVRAGATSGRLRVLGAWVGANAPPGAAACAEILAQDLDGLRLRLTLRPPGGVPQEVEAQVPLIGAHQALNAALAAAAALALEVPPETLARGLAAVGRAKHRGQVLRIGGRFVLDDCYNASPPSVRAALGSLVALRQDGRALAILGDMLELGPEAAALHEEVGAFAAGKVDLLIAVGPLAARAAEAAIRVGVEALTVSSAEEAAEIAARRSRPGDWILVKASRGMRLEQVLTHLGKLLQGTEG